MSSAEPPSRRPATRGGLSATKPAPTQPQPPAATDAPPRPTPTPPVQEEPAGRAEPAAAPLLGAPRRAVGRPAKVKLNAYLPAELNQRYERVAGAGHKASFVIDAYHRHSAAIADRRVAHPGPPGQPTALYTLRVTPKAKSQLLALADQREWSLTALIRVLLELELNRLEANDQ